MIHADCTVQCSQSTDTVYCLLHSAYSIMIFVATAGTFVFMGLAKQQYHRDKWRSGQSKFDS